MAQLLLAVSLFLLISGEILVAEGQETTEREVLIRDRLVLALCDQIDEYFTQGELPPALKSMPEKYKKIKPGIPGSGSINGFKVTVPGAKRKRHAHADQPVLDFL